MEIWKKVKGFENYEISNLGTLKVNLKYRKYRDYNSKILRPVLDKDGYYRTVLTNSEFKKNKLIHRLVAEMFIRNPKNKLQVNHKNGIKTDNRVENLEWVTAKENTIHSYNLGLQKPKAGESHNMCKLTEIQVENIILNIGGLKQRELAEMYKISQTQISRIINKKRWHHHTKKS